MNSIKQLFQNISLIEERLGYSFKNKELLVLAFVHRSFFNENREQVSAHNERLEFLGDSVLGLLISNYLYEQLPEETEGQLSYLRSRIVDAASCAQYIQKLSVGEFVLLGRGEKMNDGKGRETILADLFEALVGAIYLDGGMDAALQFFKHKIVDQLQLLIQQPGRNWKADFQDYCQKKYQRPPTYKVVEESGPDHNKVFVVAALLGEQEYGRGEGSSKKQAEQAAAEAALGSLNDGQTKADLGL
ncbi:MAG TPA: ribonuclease III [Rhabdochlamydiaceae bacterium]|nr:ribonuclease III [Rhabdochlamydiaceae bacterium]